MSKTMDIKPEVLRKLLVSVLIVLTVVYVYMFITGARFEHVSTPRILCTVLMIYFGWFLSSMRLYYLVKIVHKNGDKLFLACINARFLGDLLAKITPSSIGGEPARAYYLSMATQTGFIENYALAIYEVYYDVVFTCVAGIFASIFFLPLSLPVLFTSAITLALWVLFFNCIQKPFMDRLAQRLRNPNVGHGFFKRIVEKFNEFRHYYKLVSHRVRLRDRAILWTITVIVNIVWAISITPLITGYDNDVNKAVFKSMMGYVLMQAISILPTPGGSGVAEYGLTLVLQPNTVVTYRITYYFAPMIYGLAVLFYLLTKTKRD